MSQFNIGIDTGGTYTDAVMVDTEQRSVLASAKALTTKGDLSYGVIESLLKVLGATRQQVKRTDIGLVSLSTTLATNALVEGQGSNVAVLLIGFDDDMAKRTELLEAIPSARVVRVAGGHGYSGQQVEALDEAAILAAIEAQRGVVEAWAIASVYSVRNPAHELQAKALITEHAQCPVTCSHELSSALNGPRRALTAAFNARIIAMIVALVKAVRQVMQQQNITAPLMIVKGDGSIASADTVVERPIETILSGPAASVIGANFLSGRQDFIISDIGGTTTDVAIVKNGWPDLNEKGAMIGEHRTMVQAIDMQTIGLGGDSAIEIDYRGNVSLNNYRVVPVSLIGHLWPSVIKALKSSLAQGMGLGLATSFVMRPQGFDNRTLPADLSATDRSFINELGDEPRSWSSLINNVSDRRRVRRLAALGVVQVAGLTPSDAAHVLGKQSQWSLEAAELVCLMMGRSYGKISWDERKKDQELQTFAAEIFHAMVTKSTHILLERLTRQNYAANDPLISRITEGEPTLGDVNLCFQPQIPLVAVGGPAQVFYADVAKRLNSELSIPEHFEVANAVGAAIGLMRVVVEVQVTRSEQSGFFIHGSGEPVFITSPTEALQQADQLAQEWASERIQAMQGQVSQLQTELTRLDMPDMAGDMGLISATITAQALGY